MRRSLAPLLSALLLAGCDDSQSSTKEAKPPPPPPQLERVQDLAARVPPGITVDLLAKPNGPTLARVGPRTEFGSPQTLSIVLRKGRWVAVRSTKLRNGQLGWVREGFLRRLNRPRRIVVDLSKRRLELIENGAVLRSEAVAIGSPDSPTPPGSFYITDKLPGPDFGPYYGCCILALSGRQPNLPQGWSGGDRLAIHGTPSPDYGRAVTNGCLHLPRESLEVLMKEVPLGTPVEIRA